MTMSKKQKLLIIISIVSALIVGGIFGFLLGKNAAYREQLSKKELYRTSCSFYVNTATTNFESLSSSDLSVDPSIFDSITEAFDSCSAEIAYAYPGVEYSMTLEEVEGTTCFNIIVTGENPEQITEICNMAARLLPEKVHSVANGFSCKLIDRAKIPTTPIG